MNWKKKGVPIISILILSVFLYRYASDRAFLVSDTQAEDMVVYSDRLALATEDSNIDYSNLDLNGVIDFSKLDQYDKSNWSYEMRMFADAKRRNDDVLGYINIPGTKVDYPVLWKEKDNEHYLRKDINQEYLLAGSIFMDGYAHPKWKGITLLHGHAMKNGTMFRSNLQYVKQDYFEKNKRIKIFNGREDVEYEVFSVYILDAKKETVPLYYEDMEDYDKWLKNIQGRSLVTGGKIYDKGDLLVLNQCSYQFQDAHTIVVASRVPK